MSDLVIKLSMLIVFFGVMIGIGLSCRHHANNVAGFVLLLGVSLLCGWA